MENREIKFRGKSTIDDSWVYGHYFYDEIKDRHFILLLDPTGQMREAKVKPETVGQYIGKKDKNGVEIYTDDCFSIDNRKTKTRIGVATVVWDNFYLKYDLKDTLNDGEYSLGWFEKNSIVIGNKHDNPKLNK